MNNLPSEVNSKFNSTTNVRISSSNLHQTPNSKLSSKKRDYHSKRTASGGFEIGESRVGSSDVFKNYT